MQWFADDYLHQKYYPHNKFYRHYQDDVWGIPPHNDRSLFEQYTIGVFAAGLSWNASFLRYPALSKAFHQWDFSRIVQMDDGDVDRLAADPRLIRNRRKIRATIENAATVIRIQNECGSFDDYLWGLAGYFQRRVRVPTIAELGATSPIGDAVSKQMKKDGFRFAGPVSVYSFLGSIGIMDARPDGKGWEDDPKSLIKPYGEQGENTFDVR